MKLPVQLITCAFLVITFVSGCSKTEETLTDADQTAALKNVTLTYNGLSYVPGLPAGALSGKTFDELMKEDSATYSNPENYSIAFTTNMTADNNKDDARDAKFEGMAVHLVMDTNQSSPIRTATGPFTVIKKTSMPLAATGNINLKTHRHTGMYIFRQIAASSELATTLSPLLYYKIGTLDGTIPFPSLYANIPTTADAKTKAFLQGLISAGVF